MVQGVISPDYQQFELDAAGRFASVGRRMQQKMKALPDIDLKGKAVLDIGCDHGFWAFRAAQNGAASVLGLDRGRPVNGDHVDLPAVNQEVARAHEALSVCRFERINLGRQWLEYGRFDVAYMMSMYHHVFEAAGDHVPIWFWLHRHLKPGGVLIWENPLVAHDSTVARWVTDKKNYHADAILGAAARYFDAEHIGPAIHSPTREVYLFRPRRIEPLELRARPVDGVKGASKAMVYNNGARADEVESILGFRPYAGSLNLRYEGEPDLSQGYYRTTIQEFPRGNIEGRWYPRMTRFYPVTIDGYQAVAVHFEDKTWGRGLTECYAPIRLRDHIGETVTLRW